ncbi:MAG: NAD(P)H-dependent oxidoreductase [Maricaulaceae bacterium]
MDPKTIALIEGHPDPAGGHLCHALGDAYAQGAEASGFTVHRLALSRLDIPLIRTKDEFESAPPQDSDIARAQAQLAQAQHWVFVYPLWLGTMPALLKAFLEQVTRGGFALTVNPEGVPKPGLKGHTARVVITMGMPAFAFRLMFGAASLKTLQSGILGFAWVRPVRATLIGGVDGLSPNKAELWLERVRALGREGR